MQNLLTNNGEAKGGNNMAKKIGFWMLILLSFFGPSLIHAYTITDPSNDAIGVLTFEGYGINVYNFTPGTDSGVIYFEIFTNYPEAGLTVGSWDTKPADIFIYERYYGNWYIWAIPLVSYDVFNAGTMYAVKSYKISDDYEPTGGGYIYNHNIPVRINELGSNYGNQYFTGGSVQWQSLTPGKPDYKITVTTNVWEDDPNAIFRILWGTATCANDVIEGQIPVPEPGVLILMGIGLSVVGLAARRYRRV